MKERPILFSGPMVRAILDGRKTQTRRAFRNQGKAIEIGMTMESDAFRESVRARCPYGQPGDRLWVRETWCHFPETAPDGMGENTYYLADEKRRLRHRPGFGTADGEDIMRYNGVRWRSPIHMPRWASRLTLELTEIRVQRVREISEEDARAEGCSDHFNDIAWCQDAECEGHHHGVKWHFRRLWDSLNAKRGHGWDANPWVWALTFRVVP